MSNYKINGVDITEYIEKGHDGLGNNTLGKKFKGLENYMDFNCAFGSGIVSDCLNYLSKNSSIMGKYTKEIKGRLLFDEAHFMPKGIFPHINKCSNFKDIKLGDNEEKLLKIDKDDNLVLDDVIILKSNKPKMCFVVCTAKGGSGGTGGYGWLGKSASGGGGGAGAVIFCNVIKNNFTFNTTNGSLKVKRGDKQIVSLGKGGNGYDSSDNHPGGGSASGNVNSYGLIAKKNGGNGGTRDGEKPIGAGYFLSFKNDHFGCPDGTVDFKHYGGGSQWEYGGGGGASILSNGGTGNTSQCNRNGSSGAGGGGGCKDHGTKGGAGGSATIRFYY